MRRIGTTDNGYLMEITGSDLDALRRIVEACEEPAAPAIAPAVGTVIDGKIVTKTETTWKPGLSGAITPHVDVTWQPAPDAPARPVATVSPTAKPTPAPTPETAVAPARKACVECGREFQPRTSEVTCSPACKRSRELRLKRAYAIAKTSPKRQAKRQALGLTKDARAARLEQLGQVSTRMGFFEPDPVEALIAKAGGTVDGD
jgi:hypothetical protein